MDTVWWIEYACRADEERGRINLRDNLTIEEAEEAYEQYKKK